MKTFRTFLMEAEAPRQERRRGEDRRKTLEKRKGPSRRRFDLGNEIDRRGHDYGYGRESGMRELDHNDEFVERRKSEPADAYYGYEGDKRKKPRGGEWVDRRGEDFNQKGGRRYGDSEDGRDFSFEPEYERAEDRDWRGNGPSTRDTREGPEDRRIRSYNNRRKNERRR